MLDMTTENDADAPLPNTDAALAFLERWRSGGPWVLTAIPPDRRSIATATFSGETLSAARRWLNDHNGLRNLYFHVNPATRALTKKAEREDIAALAWLHVDIDPRAGEDIESERARALGLLTTNLPVGVPPPTAIVFSGGGYQGFWRLVTPLPIEGDLERAEDAKLWNLALERAFGADKCHNVDRIMRLPGTINLPDAGKLKKGRVPTLATLVEFFDERCYPLDTFKKAAPLAIPAPGQAIPLPNRSAVESRESAPPVTDLAAFQAQFAIHDRVMRIIALGNDRALSGAKDDDDSRSSWMLDAVCQLVRHGVPDGVIHAIITDPNHGVSDHVLDQGSPIRYAWSQIRRAHMFVSRDPRPPPCAPPADCGSPALPPVEDFERGDRGSPKATQHNIRVALRRMNVRLAYDEFAGRAVVEGLPALGPRLDDDAMTRLWLEIERQFGFLPGREYFWKVVSDEARRASFHPVRDYLAEVKWDGTHRIDRWTYTYLRAADSEYTRAVGRLLLVAAVRRVRRPGCQFDEMPVLESPQQGLNKSSALRVLAVRDEWFGDDLPLGCEGRVVVEQTRGKWIIEASELKGLRGKRAEQLKAFLSRRFDTARMSYGRLPADYPRHFIPIGTTNEEHYLHDPTGNRRIWPVRIGKIDLAALLRDRDQLWAEAAAAEAEGESIRLDEKLWAAAGHEQSERMEQDPWDDLLADIEAERIKRVENGNERVFERVTTSALLTRYLGKPTGQQTPEDCSRLAACMKRLGWGKSKLVRVEGKPQRGYERAAQGEKPAF